ncbi:MAG: SAM-dependent methyltransferase [Thermodesulfobacteriota bacterium]
MNDLTEIIKEEIINKGGITFAEFMETALYHPGLGYYTSGGARVGKSGDYYTSPSVDPAFGEVLAGFIARSASLLNAPGLRVMEFGGGAGTLAGDILDSLERNHPECYARAEYLIIEKRSPTPDALDKELEKHGAKIEFISDISEMGPDGVSGIILSNELVDALPFHRVRFRGGSLSEIFVTLRNNEFAEVEGEPSTPEISRYFDGYGISFRDGQEAEVNLNARRWLEAADKALKKGFILTIDYGFLAPELYGPERMKGTYKCMHKHSISENPYENIGGQDITAHVDFSNLIRTGDSLGLKKIKYTTQGQFLIDWGVLDFMSAGMYGGESLSADETFKRNRAIKNLFLPDSMGNSFKVLLQSKNIETSIEDFYPESTLKLSFGVL